MMRRRPASSTRSTTLGVQSPLEFLQGSAGPREAGGARKSKLLQREVLVPIRLLHKRPISVGDPVDVQRPPEDLAHQNSGGLMGQGGPQKGRPGWQCVVSARATYAG